MCDVYLYEMISANTVYLLDENFSYPQPNQYAEIKRYFPSVGGEAVTIDFAAAVAACVCLTIHHALNAPQLDGVLEFVKRNKPK